MQFEVYGVAPMHRGFRSSGRDQVEPRTVDTVAQEILTHYENVAERGGQIIASHTVAYSNEGLDRQGDVTFLVAEFPEAPTS